MPEIIFDGHKVAVPAGTNLIEAANQVGVHVPVFCYQKELGPVGACRVCAVTVTMNGKARTVMGCMTQAQDGMEISTLDDASVNLRKYVLEWLMENHPHDCPICDEGGECQLQDLTIAAGHGIRRYDKKKRTFQNQFLGEFVTHEMNRCITCYRCSRFYQDYAGGRDFSATGSRDRVYFGRFEDGPFESPFSGNLVEMCPTGVFTDKLFRYKTRVWDLEIAPSVCPHCSVGCSVRPGSRHRVLQRVRAGTNEAVNGPFLCDRGQFGHSYVMNPERPRTIRANGQLSTWEEALGLAAGSLLGIAREHGAKSIAVIGSPRASLETHASMRELSTGPLGGLRVSHFDDPAREARALAALGAQSKAGVPALDHSDIEACDVLIVAGTSLVDEAPLAALAARQVGRQGGRLFVLNAGEHYLGDVAEGVLPLSPAELASTLTEIDQLVTRSGGNGNTSSGMPTKADLLARIAGALSSAERPGLLIGSDLVDGAGMTAGAKLATTLKGKGKDARLGYLFPGPNGFGAAALSNGATLTGLLRDIEGGKLRACILVETDPGEWSSETLAALSKLELLIVLDYLPGTLHERAQLFLPTTVTYESSGIYINRAGRAQEFAPARVPGLDVLVQIKDASFPREFRRAPIDGDARPAWWVLEQLRELAIGKPAARGLTGVRDVLKRSGDAWKPLYDLRPGNQGVVLDATAMKPVKAEPVTFAGGALTMYRMDRTLGSEVLSRGSEPMLKMAGPPAAMISTADAARLGVNGRIAIEAGGNTVEMSVRSLATVPRGVVLVPRDVVWPKPVSQGSVVQVKSAKAQEVSG